MGTPSATNYSLAYFEDIFGGRNDEFRDLLAILLEMLVFYHSAYPEVARSPDPEELSQFRHKHVTLIENLQLARLKQLSIEVASLTGEARERNITEVQSLVSHLIEDLRVELG